MSRINHQNIDKWLFDYSEGNLSGSQIRELNTFLQTHPEYQLDQDAWNNAQLTAEEVAPYAYTDQLMNIAAVNPYTRYAIAASVVLFIGVGSYALYEFSSSEEISTAKNEISTSSGSNQEISLNRNTTGLSVTTTDNSSFISNHNFDAVIANSIAYRNATTSNNTKNPVATNNNSEQPIGINLNNNAVNGIQNNPVLNNGVVLPNRNNNRVVLANQNNPQPQNNQQTNRIDNIANNNNQQNTNAVVSNNGNTNDPNGLNRKYEIPANRELLTKLFQPLPVLNTSDAGEIMAREAMAFTKTDHDHDSTLAEGSNLEKDNHRRKKFLDFDLGFHNNRDHQLLVPGNMNTAEYAGFAGSSVSPALSFNYRNQWTSSDHSVQSAGFVYDQYSKKIKSAWGFGAKMLNASDGSFTKNQANIYYSPKFKISRSFTIEPGISLSAYQQNISGSAYSSGNTIEPVAGRFGYAPAPGANKSTSGFDLTASTLINTKYFYAAVGVDHILNPRLNIAPPPVEGCIPVVDQPIELKFKMTAGTDFKSRQDSKFSLSPQISFMHQGYVTEFWAGSLVRYDWLMLGASASHNGQFSGLVGVQAGMLKFAYNFDVTKSYSNELFYASHELSLRLSLSGLSRKSDVILNSPN